MGYACQRRRLQPHINMKVNMHQQQHATPTAETRKKQQKNLPGTLSFRPLHPNSSAHLTSRPPSNTRLVLTCARIQDPGAKKHGQSTQCGVSCTSRSVCPWSSGLTFMQIEGDLPDHFSNGPIYLVCMYIQYENMCKLCNFWST